MKFCLSLGICLSLMLKITADVWCLEFLNLAFATVRYALFIIVRYKNYSILIFFFLFCFNLPAGCVTQEKGCSPFKHEKEK